MNRKSDKKFVSLQTARENKIQIDWKNYSPPVPSFLGNKTFDDFPLEEIRKRVDWTPFFNTWELYGKYPAILTDKVVGAEATKLFNDANKLLDEVDPHAAW